MPYNEHLQCVITVDIEQQVVYKTMSFKMGYKEIENVSLLLLHWSPKWGTTYLIWMFFRLFVCSFTRGQ